jgi:hypothetical protein
MDFEVSFKSLSHLWIKIVETKLPYNYYPHQLWGQGQAFWCAGSNDVDINGAGIMVLLVTVLVVTMLVVWCW